MLPTKSVRLRLGDLLAADATTLAPAALANKIALIISPFTPNENLIATDLTLATFTGSTPIAGAVGAQQVGVDPATQDQTITILDPAGGYRWEATALTALPQTVYGFALLDTTLATLFATALLPVPLAIQEVGHFVDIGRVEFRFTTQPIS